MFDKMKRMLHKKTDIGPPIRPRPDIPVVNNLHSPNTAHIADSTDDIFGKQTSRLDENPWLEDLKNIGCYYDWVEPNELVKIMNPYLYQTGAYIIRRSNTNRNALTISVVHTKSHIYHFKVLPQNDMYEVTKNLKFRTIQGMIEYFKSNDIPGSEIHDLKLTTPIIKKIPRKTRSVGDKPPTNFSLQSKPFRRGSEPDPICARNRQPTPPPSDDEDHKYTEVTEEDKFFLIRELCREQDNKLEEQSRQICQCGLYYDESLLVHDWMMHRSVNRNGKIFFVNQRTGETAWRLPLEVQLDLQKYYPSRYGIYLRLRNESQ